MVNREKLAEYVTKLRKKKGYSQRKLAMISGVSNSTISRLEGASSDTDPETLKKLAPCLDISYEQLMTVAGYINIVENRNNKEMLNVNFANRLKEKRKDRNLSQTEFGKIFNLSKQAISSYENGISFPSQDTLNRFADFFDVSIDYLLGRTDNPRYKSAEIPPELQELGVEYIALAKEFKDNKIPPEDVRKILEAVKNIRNN